MGDIAIRRAAGPDTRVIASIWDSGWREVHLGYVPEPLAEARTPESFVSRARDNIPDTIVATVNDSVVGFVVTVADEVEQMYVDAGARSGSVASTLLGAAEAAIAADGYPGAWLAVIADNARARRFYERCGWRDEGEFLYAASTQDGPVDVACRRYVKPLAGGWHHVESRDGLLLRAMVPDDAAGVLAVHGDPQVYEFDPAETHADIEQSRRSMAPIIDHWSRHGFGYWSVLVPRTWWPEGVAQEGDLVYAGVGGIQHHTMGEEPVLNVYFRLAPAVQGRGIAGRILETAVRMAERVAAGLDIVLRTRPGNATARRVGERAGFIDEGLEPGTDDMQLLRRRTV
jgi:RimJ/RimL family protein N-acetyltransferase